ncbi:UNVERIFIED_CONTAM: hypothetical protein Sangu_0316800 [Sesamum angustifolium]|uniref:Transposase n=1 Tax=Sesamum angustifolium TaxID=2727405 RepID=A0AAW2QPV1_9LAMI
MNPLEEIAVHNQQPIERRIIFFIMRKGIAFPNQKRFLSADFSTSCRFLEWVSGIGFLESVFLNGFLAFLKCNVRIEGLCKGVTGEESEKFAIGVGKTLL